MVTGWDLAGGLAWLESLRSAGAGEFPDGRAAMLVCQQCGDLECGALSVDVSRDATTVHWSHNGWQVPRESGFQPLDVPLIFESAANDYDGLLTSLAQRLVASAVTVRSSGWLWRKADERLAIRV
ncbi:hypothetical protein G7085_06790 [Tessaracoccus sp. HDW20]|uniref:hypothetical protein n=1 Tax=Tessaracoccus coleopterorum TaxID=2714950 RepID=UPI0018D46674|nr:hypothetical protein [Tessaracoccus coleopterorum]NHB84407.1 hypothetical protein [Tessaracoccus coleopterorum]